MKSWRSINPEMISEAICERFYKKIIIGDCWLWTASKRTNGYGCININGSIYSAHRVSYAIHKGLVPRDKEVCHSCDDRACVNPSHLWLGSHKENYRDMFEKGRSGNYHPTRKLICKKGHFLSENNVSYTTGSNMTKTAGKKNKKVRRCKICHAERNVRSYHRRKNLLAGSKDSR